MSHTYTPDRALTSQPEPQDLRKAVLTVSLANKVGGLVVAVVTATLSVGGSYLVNRAQTDYRMSEAEKRIERLENQKADQTALVVAEIGRQVQELTHAVAQDHDGLIRLAASLERQQARN
jgi:uncharacterized coiled-coil protein SlyX